MVRITIAALALVSIAAGAMPASAEDGTTSRIVTYSDLKLTTPAGVAELKRRVNHALNAVCGNRFSRDLQELAYVSQCRNAASQRADVAMVAAVDQEQRLAARGDAAVQVAAR